MRIRCLAHIINLACKDAINCLSIVEAEEEDLSSSQGEEEPDDYEEPDDVRNMRNQKTLVGKV